MVGVLTGSEIPGVEAKALFATIDGTIGIIASLSEQNFLILEKVERKMEDHDMSLGGLDHARSSTSPHPQATSVRLVHILMFRWRAFTNGRKKALRSNGFIDGDFVEGFLDLDKATREKVCEGIDGGVEEVERLIEEITRLH